MSQSQIPQVLQIQDSDVRLMLACSAHIGSKNISPTMSRYVWKRTTEGTHLIDLRKTWEKLVLAARVIVALENSDDVCAIALTTGNTKQVPVAQRAVLKFSQYVNCRNIAGRYTPGTFTNRIQSNFFEPRLLVVSDPVKDFQPILESSYVNMPVIAMADVDSPTKNIDIVIPCNTRSKYSVALMWWMLAREVLRLRGTISRTEEWNVLVDMFLYRDTSTEDAKNTEKKGGKIKEYHPSTWQGTDEGADDNEDQGGVDADDFGETATNETVGEPKTGPGTNDWVDWAEDGNDDEGNTWN